MKLLPPHYSKHLMSRQFISKIRTLRVVSTLFYHRSYHLRRPRGSQSGREKRRNESFQVLAKEPLGTDSHRAISKTSSGCRILIGHKNCFVLLCPIGEQFLLSSFREFVHDGYFFDHGLSGSRTGNPGSAIVPQYGSSKITVFVSGKIRS